MMAVFVQTGSSLNRYWVEMLDAQLDADCRAVYLLTFESALSGCLESSIYEEDVYTSTKKDYAIPEIPDARVPFKAYRAWVRAYIEIMRKYKLLGLLSAEAPKYDGDLPPFFEVDK